MAEAHSAVAFSFTVTPEGVSVNLNHEALYAVFDSGVRSWKKRIGKLKNNIHNGVFPASPMSLLFVVTLVLAVKAAQWDPSCGLITYFHVHVPGMSGYHYSLGHYLSTLLFSSLLWLVAIMLIRYTLKLLLTYHGWIYEMHGKVSIRTKLWLGLIRVFGGRKPMLNSYQSSLPKLPLPALEDTVRRYLDSVHPLMDEERYQAMEKLAKDFETGLGRKLQWYLFLKSWWATNYVTDWWEQYVYLRGRAPIMVNSNYYGIDALLVKPTNQQASRAANLVAIMLRYRREVDREELNPIVLNSTVPLCSAQYERQFNTTRIPGMETDSLLHLKDSNHITVYHRGRYFKVYIRHKQRLLEPIEIEAMLQRILDDDSSPVEGEEHLAALTAADRAPWAKARTEFFSKGKNKASLDAIEKAAFVLALDTKNFDFKPDDPTSLDHYGRALLHGTGYDRWFDKSFTLVVAPNGRVGFNAEHSWADAPIMAHMWEFAISDEVNVYGYREDGRCNGTLTHQPLNPIRLEWDFSKPCLEVIETSRAMAQRLCEDVDLHIMMYKTYGKGFIKTCKVSPDAYIQLALQLAYYRSAGKFCLTYESSMTRLFREGRTETVRSCTSETCAFVKAVEAKAKKPELIRLLREAADKHQKLYRQAMTGEGIDRHLFCLYVVSKYVGQDSPFLAEVLGDPWRLSTSQTPHQQTEKLDLRKHPERICAGGGFGPVADDGYGVSYIIAGEDTIFFHISSKKSCPTTDSHKFGKLIEQSFADIRAIFEDNNKDWEEEESEEEEEEEECRPVSRNNSKATREEPRTPSTPSPPPTPPTPPEEDEDQEEEEKDCAPQWIEHMTAPDRPDFMDKEHRTEDPQTLPRDGAERDKLSPKDRDLACGSSGKDNLTHKIKNMCFACCSSERENHPPLSLRNRNSGCCCCSKTSREQCLLDQNFAFERNPDNPQLHPNKDNFVSISSRIYREFSDPDSDRRLHDVSSEEESEIHSPLDKDFGCGRIYRELPPPTEPHYVCSLCSRICGSRIGLFSHHQACLKAQRRRLAAERAAAMKKKKEK